MACTTCDSRVACTTLRLSRGVHDSATLAWRARLCDSRVACTTLRLSRGVHDSMTLAWRARLYDSRVACTTLPLSRGVHDSTTLAWRARLCDSRVACTTCGIFLQDMTVAAADRTVVCKILCRAEMLFLNSLVYS